jgi:hypothetical protein
LRPKQDVADDDLGVAVGRGGIGNSAAAADERRDDVPALCWLSVSAVL